MSEEYYLSAGQMLQLDELARVLYEFDPAVMGSKIHAPEDEYLPVARHLFEPLSLAADRADIERVLSDSHLLIEGLAEAIQNIFEP